MTHEQYVQQYLGKRVDHDQMYWYQCVDLARHYCSLVRWYATKSFGGSAITWRYNRSTTFAGKRYITWYPNDALDIKKGDIVIFKANVSVQCKKPWDAQWKTVKLTQHWHVAVLHDYADNDWVIRVVEQNGGTGNGSGVWSDAIRIYWYKGKDAIAGFILQ